MKNNQVARRGQTSSKAIAATVGTQLLRQYIESRGEGWVIQQVQNGALFLNAQARSWWAGRTQAASITNFQAVQAPASVGVAVHGNARLNGSIRIKHRELVQTVNNMQLTLRNNPADGQMYPYLSTIANMYDEYRFHSVKFVLVSSLSTGAGGRWYMGWDPDSSDSVPFGPQTIMAMQHSVSMSAWQSGDLKIPASPKRYLSNFPDALKDHGALTVNVPGTLDLYVEYDVTLSNPNVTGVSDTTKAGAHSMLTNGLVAAGTGPEFTRARPDPVSGNFEIAAGNYIGQLYVSDATLGSLVYTNLNGGTGMITFRSVVQAPKTLILLAINSTSGIRFGSSVTGTPLSNRCFLQITPVPEVTLTDFRDAIA